MSIAPQSNHGVVESLNKLLADSYVLQLKIQNYHWNVTGPHFAALHALFGEQYAELAAAIDDIAERIRALGHKVPANFTTFARLATVHEETAMIDAVSMLRTLNHDHQTVAEACEKVVKAAQESGDEGTADLAIGRLRAHHKAAWMLESHLE